MTRAFAQALSLASLLVLALLSGCGDGGSSNTAVLSCEELCAAKVKGEGCAKYDIVGCTDFCRLYEATAGECEIKTREQNECMAAAGWRCTNPSFPSPETVSALACREEIKATATACQ